MMIMRLGRHKGYQCVLMFNLLFRIANPKFDWVDGQRVSVDYNPERDELVIRRVFSARGGGPRHTGRRGYKRLAGDYLH